MPPQPVGPTAATRHPPAPCAFRGSFTSLLGCRSRPLLSRGTDGPAGKVKALGHVGLRLVDFPLLLLLGKSPYLPRKANFSHFFVSCFWYFWFLAFFSLFCFPLCTQQEEPLAKSSRVRRRKKKGPDDICFLQAELKAGSSQHFPKASHHLCSFHEKQKGNWILKKTVFQNATDLRIVCSLVCTDFFSKTGLRSCSRISSER